MPRLLLAVACTLLALLAAASPAAAAKKPAPAYLVGAAKASTDPLPHHAALCLGGYSACPRGGGRTMTGVKDPMFARALAVSRGAGGMILVHTTNVGLFASYKTAPGVGAYHLRQAVARRTGLPADQVVVQADHSHSSPDTIGIWGGVTPDWLEYLQAQAVDAAVRAWEARQPADLFVATADGAGVQSLYDSGPNTETDDEFRMLWADDRKGRRIATLVNYSPHATVLGMSNTRASGDWPEWAAQIAEQRFGGTGVAGVGTLGREDFGENDDGGSTEAERLALAEADARGRLERMIDAAAASGVRLAPGPVGVRSVFLREQIGQPILALNHLPEGTIDAGGYDLSLDREPAHPWVSGTVIGTYAGAARIGDVFFGMSPGEPFPEIQQYLREEGGVTGARVHFHLGAANDFLGYMARPVDHYPQVLQEGAGYLLGCPEEEIFTRAGLPFDDACTDHWTLMVSPTIGTHVACTIQDAAGGLGFTRSHRDPACEGVTRTDGVAAPPETGAR
jgi:hypothetical protein